MIAGALTHRMVWGLLAFSALGNGAIAQFHSKGPSGQTSVNPQAYSNQPSAARAGRSYSGADVVLPEEQRQALSRHDVRLGEMNTRNVDIWGRAIHHTDGSFTESKQDLQTNTLEQITKSKNGIKLQRRMIVLDASGRPSEVMIYDGRDQFKYRGVQLYDPMGRFVEEQIYDVNGTLIRRKVQAYTTQGQKMPLRSWDYVANVPEDLRLVITRESENPEGPKEDVPEKRKGLFSGMQKGGSHASPPPATDYPPVASSQIPAGTAPPRAEPAATERKGPKLGRLFGGKK
jgi:hypothetical protein